MRQRVEARIMRPPGRLFDFIARDHWQNHPRWDPNVLEIIPLQHGPIRAGSRARVRRKPGRSDQPLEVLEFEPDARWVSRTQIGPFSLTMTALIEPADQATSRLTLLADTRAQGAARLLLPLLAPVFRRQMRASLGRIKQTVETETPTVTEPSSPTPPSPAHRRGPSRRAP
jgi:Polyketide cyclase / dehydrase and lipid transport